MTNTAAEYFDNSIEQLDGHLTSGHNILFAARSEIFDEKLDEQAKKAKFELRWKEYIEWSQSVYDTIRFTTDRQYYSVHFMQVHRTAFSINGLTDQEMSFILGFESKIKSLVEILTWLEERRSVVIRQEIAKQEFDSNNRYWLKYDEIAGKLYLNGNLLLATTRLDSPSDKLLQQVFASPNSLIEIQGVTASQISSALRDMNIKGALKKLFFPRTSDKKVFFRPVITNAEFLAEEHKDISFSEMMRNSENK